MTFFFLKEPSCLEFFVENTQEETTKLQFLNNIVGDDLKSNCKLCKMKNGGWFIKCGNIRMDLSNVPIKNMKVSEKNDTGGKVIGFVSRKWFLKLNSAFKEIYKN